MTPDEALFNEHLSDPAFLAGCDRGKWGLHGSVEAAPWPSALFWIAAAAKIGAPDRYSFKFDLDGYPAKAPAACPWDVAKSARLEVGLWPKGPLLVSKVFNGGASLYAPCDRNAMPGHGEWQNVHKQWWWQSSHTFVNYLKFVHGLLHTEDYANGPA